GLAWWRRAPLRARHRSFRRRLLSRYRRRGDGGGDCRLSGAAARRRLALSRRRGQAPSPRTRIWCAVCRSKRRTDGELAALAGNRTQRWTRSARDFSRSRRRLKFESLTCGPLNESSPEQTVDGDTRYFEDDEPRGPAAVFGGGPEVWDAEVRSRQDHQTGLLQERLDRRLKIQRSARVPGPGAPA